MSATATRFTFDRDYKNQEQVAEFLPAFLVVYDEIVASGHYTYNDSFKGRIPGIEGPCEDTAIYLLQCLKRSREQAEKIAALLAQGYEHVERLETTTRYRHVIFYSPPGELRGEWQEWRDARLIPEGWETQKEVTGPVQAVLPKGKRTHGVFCNGRSVLVLA